MSIPNQVTNHSYDVLVIEGGGEGLCNPAVVKAFIDASHRRGTAAHSAPLADADL